MQRGAVRFRTRLGRKRVPSRLRDRSRPWSGIPEIGTYRIRVARPSDGVRRANFGAFVTRAMKAAANRGMTVVDMVEATGVAKSTIFRWRSGDWSRDPRASQVRSFCEGLGVSLAAAQRALGWTDDRQAEPEPLQNPLLVELARRLEDPNVTPEEKGFIEESLRMLLARGSTRARTRP